MKGNKKIGKFSSINEIKEVLSNLDLERLHFLGDESTTWSGLSEIADVELREVELHPIIKESIFESD